MKKIIQTSALWVFILAGVFLLLEWRKEYTGPLEVMAPVFGASDNDEFANFSL